MYEGSPRAFDRPALTHPAHPATAPAVVTVVTRLVAFLVPAGRDDRDAPRTPARTPGNRAGPPPQRSALFLWFLVLGAAV
ncbi:hypothetical protein [Streptomyces sp. NPDC048272]|uniref:hypothetical protein n=1 Tax=Streptomyces sp. NPDC048272 TaxID=3154616 RepID=UPI0034260B3C